MIGGGVARRPTTASIVQGYVLSPSSTVWHDFLAPRRGENMKEKNWSETLIIALAVVVCCVCGALGLMIGNLWLLLAAIAVAPVAYCAPLGDLWPLYPKSKNKSIPSAILQISHLFDIALWRVNIVTGRLGEEVYEAAPVKQAIEHAIGRGVFVQIVVVGDSLHERFTSPEHWLQSDRVSWKHVIGADDPHTIIVDGLHTRTELSREVKEGPDGEKELVNIIAECIYHNPVIAKRANAIFDSLFEEERAGSRDALELIIT